MTSRDLAVAAVVLCALVSFAGAKRDDWFLSEDEVTEARGGKVREDNTVFTKNNSIRPLMDGEKAMGSIFDDIEATSGKDDFVHAVAFDETADMIMKFTSSDPKENEKNTVSKALIRAVKRGVQVRFMANLNAYLPVNAIIFCRKLNKVCPDKNCCVPDQRHGSNSGSIHNKMWVIKRGKETVAYLGGMDIASGRWDTSSHNEDDRADQEPTPQQKFYGWHDAMYRIRGVAVIDLARHFYNRWNDPSRPAPMYSPKKFQWKPPPVVEYPGTVSAQMLRTLSCNAAASHGYYKKFAPRGEYTYSAAFKKMVKNAREYLYMEDQFMFYPEILELVAEALPRIKKLIIVTDDASAWTLNILSGIKLEWATNTRAYYQRMALDRLLEPIDGVSYADKVHVFDLVRPGAKDRSAKDLVYVHSKVYMADDKYAIIGSAGVERAAFTNDVEVSLALYDESNDGAKSFVGKLRRYIWAEHLGVKPDEPSIMDPVGAVDVFLKKAADPSWRLRKYWPPKLDESWYMSMIYEFYEPDGRCDEEDIADMDQKDADSKELDQYRALYGGADASGNVATSAHAPGVARSFDGILPLLTGVAVALVVGAAGGFALGRRRQGEHGPAGHNALSSSDF